MKILLNGIWNFKQLGSDTVMSAEVPGCNFTDLMKNGALEDPFYGTNEKNAKWVGEKDWLYFREFEVSEEQLSADEVNLVFDRLDTIASVDLNGVRVLEAKNCHLQYSIDVKKSIKSGTNRIEVLFRSPVKYVDNLQKQIKCPMNSNGQDGIPHIRKPQYHFGWDWGPVLPLSGICGDVYLETVCGCKIRDVKINQQINGNSAAVSVEVDLVSFSEGIEISAAVYSPNGVLLAEKPVKDGNAEFIVNAPQLWQTYEWSQSKQPLYSVVIRAVADGVKLDAFKRRFGVRSITLNREKDKYGSNFQFILNGQQLFAKGANWIPSDSFQTRTTKEKLEEYIVNAVNSGFNMIRVWGGGYYECDDFYDLCDEYGLLVWQDFCFACEPYPFFLDDFRQNVLDEVDYNVRRLRNHPSLCLWCGNVEIEVLAAAWKTFHRFNVWTEKFFYHILPEELRKFDVVTPYIAGSPVGDAYNKGVSADDEGDTHLWAVWHGMQNMRYYRTRNTRFCSEFGFESLPDIKCIEKFAEKKDYSLTGEVFSAHQKCASGNAKMEFYIASRFRLPKRFEDYVYLSQVCQSECVRDATEYWRRNKGRCNGSLFWQYNDCWPVCSWASVDYYGNFKALQYHAKSFFKAFTVSVEDNKKGLSVFMLNDTLEEKNAEVRLRLIGFGGEVFFEENRQIAVSPNSVLKLRDIQYSTFKNVKSLKSCVFVADLMENGVRMDRKTVIFDAEKRVRLPKTDISVDIKKDGDTAYYTLTGNVYTRLVMLRTDAPSRFSDNFFDLLPGESITVTQATTLSETELRRSLQVFDASQVEPRGSLTSDALTRLRIALKPINVLNYIYYKWIC